MLKHAALGLLSFVAPVLFVSCVGSSQPDATPPRQWPKSAELERKWGAASAPSQDVIGRQTITWTDPKDNMRYVAVSWEGTRKPKELRNSDGTSPGKGKLTVMGVTTDYYESGNEDPEISSLPVRLTSPSGQTGWYSFQFAAKEHLQGRNLPEFTW